MKRFIIAASLVALAAGSASAMTAQDQLLGGHRAEIMRLAPNADLNNLSTKQLGAISSLFSTSETRRSSNDPAGQLFVILGWK